MKTRFDGGNPILKSKEVYLWGSFLSEHDINATCETAGSVGCTIFMFAISGLHAKSPEVEAFLLNREGLKPETLNAIAPLTIGQGSVLDLAVALDFYSTALQLIKKGATVAPLSNGYHNKTAQIVKVFKEFETTQDKARQSVLIKEMAAAYRSIGDEAEAKKWEDKDILSVIGKDIREGRLKEAFEELQKQPSSNEVFKLYTQIAEAPVDEKEEKGNKKEAVFKAALHVAKSKLVERQFGAARTFLEKANALKDQVQPEARERKLLSLVDVPLFSFGESRSPRDIDAFAKKLAEVKQEYPELAACVKEVDQFPIINKAILKQYWKELEHVQLGGVWVQKYIDLVTGGGKFPYNLDEILKKPSEEPDVILYVLKKLADKEEPQKEKLAAWLAQQQEKFDARKLRVEDDVRIVNEALGYLESAKALGVNLEGLQLLKIKLENARKKQVYDPNLPLFKSKVIKDWEAFLSEYDVNAVSVQPFRGSLFSIAISSYHAQSPEIESYLLSRPGLMLETLNKICDLTLGGRYVEGTALDLAVANNFKVSALQLIKKGASELSHLNSYQNEAAAVVRNFKEFLTTQDSTRKLTIIKEMAAAYRSIGDEEEALKWEAKNSVAQAESFYKRGEFYKAVLLLKEAIKSPDLRKDAYLVLTRIANEKTEQKEEKAAQESKKEAIFRAALEMSTLRIFEHRFLEAYDYLKQADALKGRYEVDQRDKRLLSLVDFPLLSLSLSVPDLIQLERLVKIYRELTQLDDRFITVFVQIETFSEINKAIAQGYALSGSLHRALDVVLGWKRFPRDLEKMLQGEYKSEDDILYALKQLTDPNVPQKERIVEWLSAQQVFFNARLLRVKDDFRIVDYALGYLNAAMVNVERLAPLKRKLEQAKKHLEFKNDLPQLRSKNVDDWKALLAQYDVNARCTSEASANGTFLHFSLGRAHAHSEEVLAFLLEQEFSKETLNTVTNTVRYPEMSRTGPGTPLDVAIANNLKKAVLLLLKKGGTSCHQQVLSEYKVNEAARLVEAFNVVQSPSASEANKVFYSEQLAKAYEEMGDPTEAKKWRLQSFYGQGVQALTEGRWLEAVDLFSRSADQCNDNLHFDRIKSMLSTIAHLPVLVLGGEAKDQEQTRLQAIFKAEMVFLKIALLQKDVGAEILSHLKKAASLVEQGGIKTNDAEKAWLAILTANPFEMKEDVVAFNEAFSKLDFQHPGVQYFVRLCLERGITSGVTVKVKKEEGFVEEKRNVTEKPRILNQLVMMRYLPGIGMGVDKLDELYFAQLDLYKALSMVLTKEPKVESDKLLAELNEMVRDEKQAFKHPAFFIIHVLKAIEKSPDDIAKGLIEVLAKESIQKRIDVRVLLKEDKKKQTLLQAAIKSFENGKKRFPKEMLELDGLYKKLQHESNMRPEEKKEESPHMAIISQFAAGLVAACGKQDSSKVLGFLRQLIEMRKTGMVESRMIDPVILTAFRYVESLKLKDKLSNDDRSLIQFKTQSEEFVVPKMDSELAEDFLPCFESVKGLNGLHKILVDHLDVGHPLVNETSYRGAMAELVDKKLKLEELVQDAKRNDLVALNYLAHHFVYQKKGKLFSSVIETPTLFLCAKLAVLTLDTAEASKRYQLPEAFVQSMHQKAMMRLQQAAKKPDDLASWYLVFLKECRANLPDIKGVQPERVMMKYHEFGFTPFPRHNEAESSMKEALLYQPDEIEKFKYAVAQNAKAAEEVEDADFEAFHRSQQGAAREEDPVFKPKSGGGT